MLDEDRYWQALCERDAAFDGRFVFAVRSTGIFCRPSCPARRPARERVAFYADGEAARTVEVADRIFDGGRRVGHRTG